MLSPVCFDFLPSISDVNFLPIGYLGFYFLGDALSSAITAGFQICSSSAVMFSFEGFTGMLFFRLENTVFGVDSRFGELN